MAEGLTVKPGVNDGLGVRSRWSVVPQLGTGELSLPHLGIIRPFSSFLRGVRVRLRVAELHAVHRRKYGSLSDGVKLERVLGADFVVSRCHGCG
jgi:hypothetical protein